MPHESHSDREWARQLAIQINQSAYLCLLLHHVCLVIDAHMLLMSKIIRGWEWDCTYPVRHPSNCCVTIDGNSSDVVFHQTHYKPVSPHVVLGHLASVAPSPWLLGIQPSNSCYKTQQARLHTHTVTDDAISTPLISPDVFTFASNRQQWGTIDSIINNLFWDDCV